MIRVLIADDHAAHRRACALAHRRHAVGAAPATLVKPIKTHAADAVAKRGLGGAAALVRFAVDQGSVLSA